MAIKIYCDLCGQEREITQIKGVETNAVGVDFVEPRMDHRHFACVECLAKIGVEFYGWPKTESAPAAPDAVKFRKARRRGVEVIVTWKANGGFEIYSSIAAAVDRIAEKTGVVVTGADISHALLKDRVYNADVFSVKYAKEEEQSGTDDYGLGRMETGSAGAANTEKAAGA